MKEKLIVVFWETFRGWWFLYLLAMKWHWLYLHTHAGFWAMQVEPVSPRRMSIFERGFTFTFIGRHMYVCVIPTGGETGCLWKAFQSMMALHSLRLSKPEFIATRHVLVLQSIEMALHLEHRMYDVCLWIAQRFIWLYLVCREMSNMFWIVFR